MAVAMQGRSLLWLVATLEAGSRTLVPDPDDPLTSRGQLGWLPRGHGENSFRSPRLRSASVTQAWSHVGAAVSAADSRGAEASAGEQLVEEPAPGCSRGVRGGGGRSGRRSQGKRRAAGCRLKPGARSPMWTRGACRTGKSGAASISRSRNQGAGPSSCTEFLPVKPAVWLPLPSKKGL